MSNNLEYLILEKVNFINNDAEMISITDSNSGAILKKVIDGNQSYFLKIIDKDKCDLDRLYKILDIYKKGFLKTLELLDVGIISDKCYLIYKWIDGGALNTKYEQCSINDFYNYGFEIGNNFRIINQKVKIDNCFVKNYDIRELMNSQTQKFKDLYNGKFSYIKNQIDDVMMENILSRLHDLVKIFDDQEKVYAHLDIHPKNVMLDNDNLINIIDIEDLSIDYFVMNLRWSIASAFRNEQNCQFFKGFVNGFYDNKVPEIFYNQLIFILILNFVDHVIEFSEIKTEEFIKGYVGKFKTIFNSLSIYEDGNDILTNNMFNKRFI